MSNNHWGIYSIPKESKYTAVFLSINNEIQYVNFGDKKSKGLLLLSSKFIAHAPSFISGKMFFWENAIKSRLVTEITSNLDLA